MKKSIYLAITSYFPTHEKPWRCAFTYDQVNAIQRVTDKYEVVVLRPDLAGCYGFRGIRVIGFKSHTAGCWICPRLMNRGNVKEMFRTLSSAGISLADIAVVHGHLAPQATYVHALKKANPKIMGILQFHDADPYGMLFGVGRFGWLKKMSYFRYYRSLIEKMDMLVAISDNVAKVVREAPRQTVFADYEPMREAMRILRHFRPARVKPAYVLHNGVDHSVFAPAPKPTRADGFTIGCVAVFRDLKDQLSLLKAVNLLRDDIPGLTVKLVGLPHSGDMYTQCVQFIKEKSLPVEIFSSLNHEELPNFYHSLDLFVLPSYFEGFGCVFLEVHACGTPFVTCEGQGIGDFILPEESGLWLCKRQNPQDLAAKILAFYRQRPVQHLAAETDIDILIAQFLKHVEEERSAL